MFVGMQIQCIIKLLLYLYYAYVENILAAEDKFQSNEVRSRHKNLQINHKQLSDVDGNGEYLKN